MRKRPDIPPALDKSVDYKDVSWYEILEGVGYIFYKIVTRPGRIFAKLFNRRSSRKG